MLYKKSFPSLIKERYTLQPIKTLSEILKMFKCNIIEMIVCYEKLKTEELKMRRYLYWFTRTASPLSAGYDRLIAIINLVHRKFAHCVLYTSIYEWYSALWHRTQTLKLMICSIFLDAGINSNRHNAKKNSFRICWHSTAGWSSGQKSIRLDVVAQKIEDLGRWMSQSHKLKDYRINTQSKYMCTLNIQKVGFQHS